jgi:iron complex outermembrane receptor protein
MKKQRRLVSVVVSPRGRNPRPLWHRAAEAIARVTFLVSLALPAWPQQKLTDLADQSIEDLMNIEVTSVSKKEQKMSQVAAAIFVITEEDIQWSGATTIPDLLRMVPGLDVAQINSNTWAITARGFNLQFANKLLVLIDGRAVYTPLFGGVYWDTQDVPLEDIARIEVIRGPGGSVWGANAVSGVINIITKKAGDTKGALLTGGGGTLEGSGTVQYGGNLREDTSYRVFTKYLDIDHFPGLTGQNGHDGWHLLHGGFRVDTNWSTKDSLTVQSDLYAGSEGAAIVHSSLNPPDNEIAFRVSPLSGGNVLSRWHHVFSSRSDTTVQFYFDRYARSGPEAREVRNTFDFDFQHHFAWGARQDLVWGGGYRHTGDSTIGTIDQSFTPADFGGEFFNMFFEDQIALKPDRLSLSVGTKLENGYFTGFDLQPSARVAWTPSEHETFWAAVSRASRTPSRRDTDLNAVLAALPGPTELVLLGNPKVKTEHVVAYELGYRTEPSNRLSIDTTTFVNTYFGLQSIEPQPSFFQQNPPLMIVPESFANKLHGTTEGIELSAKWKVTDRWTLSPGYSFLQMNLHRDTGSQDTMTITDTEGTSPHHEAQLRSHVDLSRGFTWDANIYFVDRLPAPLIASYTKLDSQLTWQVAERMGFSVVGQNLLQDHHTEFNDQLQSVNSSLVKRSVYIKFTWRF